MKAPPVLPGLLPEWSLIGATHLNTLSRIAGNTSLARSTGSIDYENKSFALSRVGATILRALCRWQGLFRFTLK
ncbi:MAG: hypothetical protein WD529_06115 [Balneolaceae bacterium]